MNTVSEFEQRRAALIAEINEAFDGVTREDGITLHEAIALDNYASQQDEKMAARRLDRETCWQEVTDKEICECQSALSFLDWKGFRYYIPAFMIIGLRQMQWPSAHWQIDPNGILHTSSYHLVYFYPKSMRESEPSLIAEKYHFTKVQCRAVANSLRFIIEFEAMSADEVTVKAVEKWERFANETI